MKEIIEKYKKGELTASNLIHNSHLVLRGSDKLVLDWTSAEDLDIPDDFFDHAMVLKSTELDKEIEAMGKQPTEYEYIKVADSIFTLGESFNKGELFTKKFNQEWHQIKSEIQLGGLLSMNDDPEKNGIYRRVELTPEQLHERKVDELVEMLKPCMWARNGFGHINLHDMETLKRTANKALEWMESKGK